MRARAGTFLNEGEKERKEGANKEIRTNVYGGKEKEKKERRRERKLEKKKRQNESISRKVGDKERKEGGDEIRTNVYGLKKTKQNVWMK